MTGVGFFDGIDRKRAYRVDGVDGVDGQTFRCSVFTERRCCRRIFTHAGTPRVAVRMATHQEDDVFTTHSERYVMTMVAIGSSSVCYLLV
jgi:hypothetical protein